MDDESDYGGVDSSWSSDVGGNNLDCSPSSLSPLLSVVDSAANGLSGCGWVSEEETRGEVLYKWCAPLGVLSDVEP